MYNSHVTNPNPIRAAVVNPDLTKQRYLPRTVVVSNNYYNGGTLTTTAAGQQRIIVNKRVAADIQTPAANLAMSGSTAAPRTNPYGVVASTSKAGSNGPDHDYTAPVYCPPTAGTVVRPTAVIVTRNVRPSALTFATSQRNALPLTMKLPQQMSRLPVVPREPAVPTMDRAAQGQCARVRPIDPKYKEKSNRAILAFRRDQRFFSDKRKNFPTSTNNSQASAVVTSSVGNSVGNVVPSVECSTKVGAGADASQSSQSPRSSNSFSSDGRVAGEEIVLTSSQEKLTKSRSHLNWRPTTIQSQQRVPDDESVVMRLEGDLKMIVDCDKEGIYNSALASQTASQIAATLGSSVPSSSAFLSPPPKRNRPGRPRKFEGPAKAPKDHMGSPTLLSGVNAKKPRLIVDTASDKKRRGRFRPRLPEEEFAITCAIVDEMLDVEDREFIKLMLDNYQKIHQYPWGIRIPYRHLDLPVEPEINPQPALLVNGHAAPYFVDPELENIIPNAKGCARCEPFRSNPAIVEPQTPVDVNQPTTSRNSTIPHGASKRSAKHDLPSGPTQQIYPNNADKPLRIVEMQGGKTGVFACEPFKPNEFVIEYAGEVVRREVADNRAQRYRDRGDANFMFNLDDEYVIDATKMGNAARFIKHSCRPNCVARVKRNSKTNAAERIAIYSNTFIDRGEELSYDYNLSGLATGEVRCNCGARSCRTYL